MRALIKKFLSALLVIFVFNLNISSQSDLPAFSIDPGKEFTVYGEDSAKTAEILGFSESELEKQCADNNIRYLAVNENNTKQIRIIISQNDFTNSVINISGLSNDSIAALLPQIVGIEGVKGEIVTKNGQKFIKTELRSSDNGGDYILPEYITVAERKSFVLSFYNTDYADAVFESFDSASFAGESDENPQDADKKPSDYLIPAFTIVFGAVTLFTAATIIIDLYKKRRHDSLEQSEPTEQSEPPENPEE